MRLALEARLDAQVIFPGDSIIHLVRSIWIVAILIGAVGAGALPTSATERGSAGFLLDGIGSEYADLLVEDREDGDLVSLTATCTEDALWIGLEFDREIQATKGSGLVLHLDADGDAGTGDRSGCELVLDLQARNGELHPPREIAGVPRARLTEKLGVLLAPAMASRTVEIRIPRVMPTGESLFEGKRPRFFIRFGKDRVPDSGFVELAWSQNPGTPDVIPVKRVNDSSLRLMSWNIEQDGLFEEARSAAQLRILKATNPDILIIEESFRHSGEDVLARFCALTGHHPDQWYARKTDPGNVVLSRFEILDGWPILDPPRQRYGHRVSAALIQTPHGPFLVLPQHWRCCNKDSQRLAEARATLAFLDDALTPGGEVELDGDLPFVICGDLNLVGSPQPLRALLDSGFGLRPVPLRHNETPLMHTWRKAGSKYYPARMDWMIRGGDVQVQRGFVLDTLDLGRSTLRANNLHSDDTTLASDHAPIIVDLLW